MVLTLFFIPYLGICCKPTALSTLGKLNSFPFGSYYKNEFYIVCHNASFPKSFTKNLSCLPISIPLVGSSQIYLSDRSGISRRNLLPAKKTSVEPVGMV